MGFEIGFKLRRGEPVGGFVFQSLKSRLTDSWTAQLIRRRLGGAVNCTGGAGKRMDDLADRIPSRFRASSCSRCCNCWICSVKGRLLLLERLILASQS